MSSGLNCEFHEVEPGRWYYVLEQASAPRVTWDWREYADAFGPFATEEDARDHLRQYHRNPGGSYTYPFATPDHPDIADLVVNATSPEALREET